MAKQTICDICNKIINVQIIKKEMLINKEKITVTYDSHIRNNKYVIFDTKVPFGCFSLNSSLDICIDCMKKIIQDF